MNMSIAADAVEILVVDTRHHAFSYLSDLVKKPQGHPLTPASAWNRTIRIGAFCMLRGQPMCVALVACVADCLRRPPPRLPPDRLHKVLKEGVEDAAGFAGRPATRTGRIGRRIDGSGWLQPTWTSLSIGYVHRDVVAAGQADEQIDVVRVYPRPPRKRSQRRRAIPIS